MMLIAYERPRIGIVQIRAALNTESKLSGLIIPDQNVINVATETEV